MNTLSVPTSKPWYREPWPWFLMSLPTTAVIAGLTTVWIAYQSADGLVVGDYYKAGLAVNQTLAREDTARALGITATLNTEHGVLTLSLAGKLKTYPEQLILTLAHPTRQGMDQILTLHHAGSGHYRATPARHACRQVARRTGRRRFNLAVVWRAAYPVQPARHHHVGC